MKSFFKRNIENGKKLVLATAVCSLLVTPGASGVKLTNEELRQVEQELIKQSEATNKTLKSRSKAILRLQAFNQFAHIYTVDSFSRYSSVFNKGLKNRIAFY